MWVGQLRWLLVKAGTGGELAARSPLSGASKEREREPGRTRHRLTLRSSALHHSTLSYCWMLIANAPFLSRRSDTSWESSVRRFSLFPCCQKKSKVESGRRRWGSRTNSRLLRLWTTV